MARMSSLDRSFAWEKGTATRLMLKIPDTPKSKAASAPSQMSPTTAATGTPAALARRATPVTTLPRML